MPSPLLLEQFARLVGRPELLRRLGLPPAAPLPIAMTEEQRAAACALAGERAEQIGRALLAEAMALDDIQDAAAARSYLDERLAALAALVPPDAGAAIRAEFGATAARWG